MDASPTRPIPRGELQILRTRHPPATYIDQLSKLLKAENIIRTPNEVHAALEKLPDDDRLLLAVEGEQLIGYAHLSNRFTVEFGFIAEVTSIIVHPGRRREGFGRRLIAAAESRARQGNLSHLRLRSDVARSAGHVFFEALGYSKNATHLEFIRELDTQSAA